MLTGQTGRSDALEHAVKAELVATRPDRRRWRAYCGTTLSRLGYRAFDPSSARACPRCRTLTREPAVKRPT